ncbi:hypothetical protein, partial [Salmonella sp. s54836]|uniref:hypothetical protein n=1 Tax=Salmonella sp. s54836 TaxID=3159673 RepID=UPI003980FD84
MASKIEGIEEITSEELQQIFEYIESNLSFNTNVPLLESKSEPAVKYMHVPDDLKSIDHYFGIYYPKCVDEVKLLVNHGRKNKKIVRCKGS